MGTRVYVPTVSVNATPMVMATGFLAAIEPLWTDPTPVTLDFGPCGFICAPAVSMLAAGKLRRDALGLATTVELSHADTRVVQHLSKWGLSSVFGTIDTPYKGTAVPLFHQTQFDATRAVEYISTQVIAADGMPKMSPALAKETRRAFSELILNVFQHAASPLGVVSLGQLHPKLEKFHICVCDAGTGLAQHVRNSGYPGLSVCKAIRWALERGHSTKQSTFPSGLGLYLLRSFVQANGGIFRIYANGGCYTEENGKTVESLLATCYHGTLIDLQLNVRNDITYTLDQENPAEGFQHEADQSPTF